ncbi:MAG: hypothetical protein ACC742_01345 [Thermoanaerobaculales bacterium]
MAEHDSVIPAGGSGTLTAKMHTSPVQDGRVSKSVTVETDAPLSRVITLRFTVDIKAAIKVKPRLRFNLTTLQGETVSSGILLHRSDGKPLEVLDVETGDPSLVASVVPIEKPTKKGSFPAVAGDVWVEVAVDSKAQPGSRTGTTRIQLNHPDLRQLDVPYTLRVRPLIEARPAAVRLWLSGGSAEGNSMLLSLRGNGGHEFSVTGIEVSDPEVFFASAKPTETSMQHRIRVGLAKDLDRDSVTSTIEGSIRIHTDSPVRPVIDIPVLVAPKRSLTRRPAIRKGPNTEPASGHR